MNDEIMDAGNGDTIPEGQRIIGPDRIDIDEAIEQGEEMLTDLDRVSADDLRPRNGLVIIRRCGKLEDDKVGSIVIPGSIHKFDVAEVIAVGPGQPVEAGGRSCECEDLMPGMKVLVKTEGQERRGLGRTTNTLPFIVDGMEIEFAGQFDIMAIISTPDQETETNG